jgi:hypothetical protein
MSRFRIWGFGVQGRVYRVTKRGEGFTILELGVWSLEFRVSILGVRSGVFEF